MKQFNKKRLVLMILAVTFVIVSFHIGHHYMLLRDRISVLWGEPQIIDDAGLDDTIILDKEEDMKYIKVTNKGDVYVYDLSEAGIISEKSLRKSKIKNYDESIFKYDIKYSKGMLYYIKDNQLYEANILNNKEIIEPKKVSNDFIEKFNIFEGDELYIGYLSENSIKILNEIGDELLDIKTQEKPFNFDFVVRPDSTEIYTIEAKDYRNDSINLYTVDQENIKQREVGLIDILSGDKVYRLDALNDEEFTYLSYSKLNKNENSNIGDFCLQKIGLNLSNDYKISIKNGKNDVIDRINKDYKLIMQNNKLHLYLAALNLDNDLSKFSDAVEVTINKNLRIEDYEITSTTYEYSRISDVLSTEQGNYLLMKELNTGNYDVKINSNSAKFIAHKEIPKESIKGAIMQGLLSPMYSIMHMIINLVKVIIFMLVPIIVSAIIFTKKRVEKQNVKFNVLYGCFLLVFVYDFKVTYMGYSTLKYAPEILKNGYMGIIVPAIIVGLGYAFVKYYKEKIHQEAEYAEQLVIGILTSIYIATLTYAPLAYIKIIMTQG